MKFFIDSANVEDVRKANELGVICGVTTNPSLIAKEGRDFVEVIREITAIVDGSISGEVKATTTNAEEMIKEATKYGICKVNIDTDLRLAMTASIRKYLAENPADFDPRKYLGPARTAIQDMVQHKIKNVLNASNIK